MHSSIYKNINISESCVLIVQSCDSYEDVWDMFFNALLEYWPDCDLDIILNTETKTKSFGKLKLNTENYNLKLSQPKWGERLLNILKHIDKEYVITLFDDFILEGKVNVEKINACLNIMKENKGIGAFYFNNMPEAKKEFFQDFCKVGLTADYKVNSCPALWRKEVLQEVTGEIDNPWAWEFFGSVRAYGRKYEFHCAQSGKEDVFIYQYQLGGAIRRGKWVEKVVTPAIKKYKLSLNPTIRGFASESLSEGKYTLKWKVNFIILGIRMVGVRAFVPLLRAVKTKLERKWKI